MQKLMGAIALTLFFPAAYAQEEKKPMEKMHMEKKHDAMHGKHDAMHGKHDAMHGEMKKKMKHKHAAKKGDPAKKDEEHKH